MNKKTSAVLSALLAAVLYAVNIPFSKILLKNIGSVYNASFLYLGAGLGMCIVSLFSGKNEEPRLTKKELPYTVGMILLDIAAPILLMLSLKGSASSNVSLLSNFEIVATALIALAVFKEKISGKMWLAVFLITLSSVLLTFDAADSFKFSVSSLYAVGACTCWGLENNCTRKISSKSTKQIVILKGVFSGLGSFAIALIVRESFPQIKYIIFSLLLGFVSYGLSIFLYVRAQRYIGAARTSAYYAVNPFVGAAFSLLILREPLSKTYFIALAVMLAGALAAVSDTLFRKTATDKQTAGSAK